ncbi:uncharacterized protein LOC116430396 [Nomia melanderi]|uniref:uncharacterized protein LOC116430396 n=1 Tax=Nomia melanderi TaxID=2448451 RepID=UPI003FCCEAD4
MRTKKGVSGGMKLPSTVSKSVRYGLHFVGIWPGTLFPGVHKFFWILTVGLCQGYQYKYVLTHIKTNSLMETMDSLSITLPYTVLGIKLMIAWVNHGLMTLLTISRSLLCEILTTMEEDCVKYAAIDSNKIIPKTSDLSYRVTTSIAFVYLVAATTYSAGALSIPRYNDSLDRQLILNMDLPFDTNESPAYELVVTAQVIHQVAAAYTFGIFGALLTMMILHIGCLVDILCHILTNISSKDEGQVRFVAMRHQEIIMFAERIEKFFTYISLFQLFANTLTTCCLGFIIIASLRTDSSRIILIKCCWFYMVLCLEIFIYCFAGEYLSAKSDRMLDAAYQVTWYDLQPTISRQLVLLILRSQKGMPLTFGKFSTLNLENFTGIMKASASYMSVLLAMSVELRKMRTKKEVSGEIELPSTVSKSVKYGLHFVGIWPGTMFPGVHKFFWILTVGLCQGYQYKYIYKHLQTDSLMKIVDTLSITLTNTVLAIKLMIAWVNHGLLCEILTTMEEDCVKYAAIDSNKIIPKTSDLSYRITSSIAFVYLVAATTYAAGTLSVPRYNDSLDRQLILNMDLPFDTNVSPTYELIVAAQVIHQVAAAYTFGIFGALLLMMILHIGCLVDILCHILTNISSKDEGQVRFVAMRHQEIIMFTERIEKFFTYISLLQLLANTLTSCCLGFLIIVSLKASSGNLVIIKCCWFYMVLCLEIFIYCFAGEYLNVKSDMIIDAAYQVTWYDLQPTISRQLVLLILRSQKGMPLTFGKFSTLSLESFSRIMKASASYMSVLLAMY